MFPDWPLESGLQLVKVRSLFYALYSRSTEMDGIVFRETEQHRRDAKIAANTRKPTTETGRKTKTCREREREK